MFQLLYMFTNWNVWHYIELHSLNLLKQCFNVALNKLIRSKKNVYFKPCNQYNYACRGRKTISSLIMVMICKQYLKMNDNDNWKLLNNKSTSSKTYFFLITKIKNLMIMLSACWESFSTWVIKPKLHKLAYQRPQQKNITSTARKEKR